MTTIEFDGLVFDDAASAGFTISTLAGWWDGAPMRTPTQDRPQADGSFGAFKNWRSARTITVEGSYVGATMADTYDAMTRLSALQASGVPSTFRVNEPNGSKQSVVALALAPQMPTQLFSPFFTFSFAVVAYDPYRYGDTVDVPTGVPVASGGLIFPLGSGDALIDMGTGGTSGRIAITNSGTAAVFPSFDVSGGLAGGFVVTDVTDNTVVRFERQIPDGSTVFVNQRTGRAYIDTPSSDVSGSFTSRGWFSVGPGETHQVQFQPLGVVTGTPVLTMHIAPAF